MRFFYLFLLNLYIASAQNATVSIPLENGSFDEQTFGKDGVVLFYNYESEPILGNYLIVADKFKDDKNINFWHINCDHAPEFCDGRPEVEEAGIPSMLYSFRNELWEAQGCKTYKEHAFETFFKTKLQENCLNTPELCSSIMNLTLSEYGDGNHTEIKKLYLEEEEKGLDIEAEWQKISNEIQREWNEKRTQFVVELRNSDEKLKVYKLLMEKLHSDAYEKNEGETQQIVIDMRDKYLG
jgi:hypothetical protein